MVEGEETGEDFPAGGGGDGVAHAVILGEVINLVKIVGGVNIIPAVGGEDGKVHLAVETAEGDDPLFEPFRDAVFSTEAIIDSFLIFFIVNDDKSPDVLFVTIHNGVVQ